MKNIGIPENKLLTVIVPIYNTAQYLSKCIMSIINQQYKQLDIILIDDGSTDESGKICDEFLQMDSRIRVFHRKNQGLVAARKFGAELARGDLITFVDSDDWIESDMYFQMMDSYMKFEPDMVTSGITIENNDNVRHEIDKVPEGIYESEEIRKKIIPCMMYDDLIGERGITPSVWNKIYKVKLFKETIIELEEGLVYGEDAAISYLYITRASKIMILSNSWYHYVTHSNSMVNSYSIKSFEQIYQFYNYMKKWFLELGLWKQMETQVKEYTKTFLLKATNNVFDSSIENAVYLFPFESIEKGSRIVIYGAGKVGISYRESLLKSGYAELRGWVDKDHVKLNSEKHIVESPDTLENGEIDYIVIAIKNEEIVSEIKESLKILGIRDSKIIWKPPIRLNCRI